MQKEIVVETLTRALEELPQGPASELAANVHRMVMNTVMAQLAQRATPSDKPTGEVTPAKIASYLAKNPGLGLVALVSGMDADRKMVEKAIKRGLKEKLIRKKGERRATVYYAVNGHKK
jgi:hypothetical protein